MARELISLVGENRYLKPRRPPTRRRSGPGKKPGFPPGPIDANASHSLRAQRRRGKLTLLAMAAPFVVLVFLFAYLPLHGWIYAFFNYKPGLHLFRTQFVGLKNFTESVVFDSYLLVVIRNSLILSFLNLLLTPVPILFAVLLTELGSTRFKKAVQTFSTIPFYLSWVIVYAFAFSLFNSEGLVKQLLYLFGNVDARVDILTNNRLAWFFQTGLSLWKSLGYTAIIYFAAISSIDPEQYDAAKVDGANRLQKILHITLPGIASTYVVILILTISNLLNNGFDQYFVFYNGLVADKIEVLDVYIFNVGLRTNDIPFATAIGIYKTFLSLALLFAGNLIAKKIRGEGIL